jgi:hypothetical protein
MIPYKEPEHKMICPECGSKKVELDVEHDVKSSKNGKLQQFKCLDCECVFIPAIVTNESKNCNIDKWSKKVRMVEGNNNDKSWSNIQSEYIIIKKVNK